MNDTIILGGGVAGLSLASFLEGRSVTLEKSATLGGLSRSYKLDGIDYDIGPHIIFSKNKEVLDLHTQMIETNRIRRSNQIFHKGKYVKYPFENDLVSLPPEDRDYCLTEFLNNPYENCQATNMLQFFLKTFGEGITRSYLQPYNQKIWKFDPSCLDMQMVERIPKPPREDVIASASGTVTEGYTHQLYFHYPKSGGFQTLIDAYAAKARQRSEIRTNASATRIEGQDGSWTVWTRDGPLTARRLINCMPLHDLFTIMPGAPAEVESAVGALRYNSIHVIALHLRKDFIGDHFALYFADPETIFHRLSKLNFLGENYSHPDGGSTILLEITFRPKSYIGSMSKDEILGRALKDLTKLGLAHEQDVLNAEIRTEEYAYVVYDLDHRRNADLVLSYLTEKGIHCVGRFAQFEYLNSDGVVENTLRLARRLNMR